MVRTGPRSASLLALCKGFSSLGRKARGTRVAVAYGFLVFATICFGANTTLARLAVGEVSPMVIVARRWLLVVWLLVPLNNRTWAADRAVLKGCPAYVCITGAFSLSAFTGAFFLAAHHTTAINMGIIAGMLPVFVLVGALVFYRTPTRPLQWAGAGITVASAAVVASAGEFERLLAVRLNAGDMLIALATLLYSGYTLGLRQRAASCRRSVKRAPPVCASPPDPPATLATSTLAPIARAS